jgi:hypothetical protein
MAPVKLHMGPRRWQHGWCLVDPGSAVATIAIMEDRRMVIRSMGRWALLGKGVEPSYQLRSKGGVTTPRMPPAPWYAFRQARRLARQLPVV